MLGGLNTTYRWDRSINGGAYAQVGTSPTLSLTIQPGAHYTMSLRLTVTFDGRTAMAYRPVVVAIDETCTNWKLCN